MKAGWEDGPVIRDGTTHEVCIDRGLWLVVKRFRSSRRGEPVREWTGLSLLARFAPGLAPAQARALAEALGRLWRSVPSAGRELPAALLPNPVTFARQVRQMLAADVRPDTGGSHQVPLRLSWASRMTKVRRGNWSRKWCPAPIPETRRRRSGHRRDRHPGSLPCPGPDQWPVQSSSWPDLRDARTDPVTLTWPLQEASGRLGRHGLVASIRRAHVNPNCAPTPHDIAARMPRECSGYERLSKLGDHGHAEGKDRMALSRRKRFRLLIALIGAAAVLGAAVITVVFSSPGTHISQHGDNNTACVNSQCL